MKQPTPRKPDCISSFFRCILMTAGAISLTGLLLLAVLFYFAASILQIDTRPEKADYLVLLGGNAQRAVYGAELYNEGFAPYCLISVPKRKYFKEQAAAGIPQLTQEEKYTKILRYKKVPQEALRYFGNGSVSTYEEGLELKQLFGDKPVQLLVVTSTYHARRAEFILSNMLPNAQITITSAPDDIIPLEWWKERDIAAQVVLETAKTMYFLLGGGFTEAQDKPAVTVAPNSQSS
ncbi:MAG: YdcF family protein [Desulfovibrio sp.]